MLPVPCLTNERESRFGAKAAPHGPKTTVFLVFGPRTVYGARMAASNKLRVTPSHSMQPTTSLHQWIVHTPTYGRSVASKPAGFGSYERSKSPALRPYIGYMSSQWHTRQSQPPRQLAAISWCRSADNENSIVPLLEPFERPEDVGALHQLGETKREADLSSPS